jgi:hypothetical protein
MKNVKDPPICTRYTFRNEFQNKEEKQIHNFVEDIDCLVNPSNVQLYGKKISASIYIVTVQIMSINYKKSRSKV